MYDRSQTIARRRTLLTAPIPHPAAQLDRRAWGTLLVLCGALFLDALDVSMIEIGRASCRERV